MIEVELPDGTIAEFPDDMAPADIEAVLQKQFAPPADRRSFSDALYDNIVGVDDGVMSYGEKLATALNMGGEGLTLGVVGDEAAAKADQLIGRGSYDERLRKYRSDEAQFSKENPVAATASQVAPMFLLPSGAAMRGGTLLAKAAQGALAGGAGAGLFGFMEGEGGFKSRLESAENSAKVGGLLGAAAPVAGAAIARGVDRVRGNRAIKKAAQSAPTRAQTEAQASALFDSVKGQNIPRAPFRSAADDAINEAIDSGMDSMLTPGASRVASKIDDAAQQNAPEMSMRELNVLRRQAGVPAGNFANRTEKAIGTRFIKAVDDYVDRVAPQLGEQGREARAMWSKLRKMDQIDEIFDRADQYASGFQNGLMLEFRKILKNKKLQRGFTKAELEAMKRVTNPGLLQSLIRQVGRFGFSLDNGSNALGGALGAGAGGALGGFPGAIVGPIIGTAARKWSERLTTSAAQRVGDVVRAGDVTLPQVSNQTRGILDEILLRSGIAAGSQQ
jgi:hypothetical protein